MEAKDKRPVKVLQIGMTRNWGGLETYLMQQFHNLDPQKVQYDFVNITGEHDIVFQEDILSHGSRIYKVCSRHINPLRHYWQWLKLLGRVGSKYGAIVLNTNSLGYVFPLWAAKFFGIPKRIIHSHNGGFENRVGFVKGCLIKLNKCLLRQSATDYWACSQRAGEWMFGNRQAFTVIPNAIRVSDFAYCPEVRNRKRAELGLEGQLTVGHVGRFTNQKNHQFLLEIFAELCKLHDKARLLLAGDAVEDASYLENAKRRAKELKLEDKVMFLGMRSDVKELMQAMDCFVLPSKFEGLPLVGVEAQAAGLPCFFADTITKEIGISSSAHFLSLQETPQVWARQILAGVREGRQDNAAQIGQAGYDIEIAVKDIEKYFSS
ncbi:MAG: glycosyltransferase family 1 protein [Selenomonas sp.]|nr:glycosyltransferase family 1 protein [Selenomonas sp.]